MANDLRKKKRRQFAHCQTVNERTEVSEGSMSTHGGRWEREDSDEDEEKEEDRNFVKL